MAENKNLLIPTGKSDKSNPLLVTREPAKIEFKADITLENVADAVASRVERGLRVAAAQNKKELEAAQEAKQKLVQQLETEADALVAAQKPPAEAKALVAAVKAFHRAADAKAKRQKEDAKPAEAKIVKTFGSANAETRTVPVGWRVEVKANYSSTNHEQPKVDVPFTPKMNGLVDQIAAAARRVAELTAERNALNTKFTEIPRLKRDMVSEVVEAHLAGEISQSDEILERVRLLGNDMLRSVPRIAAAIPAHPEE